MARERDKNRKMFHRGHYEVIAARFREQVSRYINDEGEPVNTSDPMDVMIGHAQVMALRDLAEELSARFEFDNDQFDRGIFLERCGLINVVTTG